jgi:hypothetical protein
MDRFVFAGLEIIAQRKKHELQIKAKFPLQQVFPARNYSALRRKVHGSNRGMEQPGSSSGS